MATAPEDRYASCRALADDIERWTADEPVKAWQEPFSRRARRWARRHRTTVAAAAVALVAGVLGLSAVLAVRTRANFELKAANDHVREAVDRMLTEVGAVDLADVPHMEPVRERLLRAALGFYENFLNQKGSDPRLRRELARVQISLAQVQDLLGEGLDADQSYRKAIKGLETGVTDPRADLARAWDGLGVVLKKVNRFRDAEGALREGLRLRAELAAERPKDSETRGALAESGYHLATLLARISGRRTDDESAYRKAVALQEQLVADSRGGPESPEFRAARAVP